MRELALPSGDLSVLCVGAHPDDIEIGCGATLLLLGRSRAVRFSHLILTGTPDRRREAEHAAALFDGAEVINHTFVDGRLPAAWDGVKSALEELAARLPVPDVIFAPRVDDAHQDHRLLGRLATTTWRNSLLLHYEIPKWDGDFSTATTYVRIPDDVARLKASHLHTAFASQHARDWWGDELFLSVMRIRGMECRSRYAEAFVLAKGVLSVLDPALAETATL
jgi:LmbE family N-acetylglucosaminyl deacetylase